MSGVKGRSGPRRKSKNRADAHRSIVNMLPSAVICINETILKENRDRLSFEAAVYTIDQALGKAKQRTEIDVQGVDKLGAGVVTQLFKLLAEERKKLIQEETLQLTE